jgi:lipooligosaccharide transport system permease protein
MATTAVRRPPGPARAIWSVCVYLCLVWRSFAVSSLLSSVLAPLLTLLAMGLGLGSLVNARSGGVDGVGYLQYIAPALIVATALQTAVFESSYPMLGRFLWGKQFYATTATPVSPRQTMWGSALYVALRLLVGVGVFYLVVLCFGAAGGPAGVLVVPISILVGMSVGVWMFALDAVLEKEAVMNLVFRLGLVPATLFSGSFFPIERIPVALRWLAWISPLWHGNELARAAAIGGSSVGPMLGHLAYLLVLTISGGLLAGRLFQKRLIR